MESLSAVIEEATEKAPDDVSRRSGIDERKLSIWGWGTQRVNDMGYGLDGVFGFYSIYFIGIWRALSGCVVNLAHSDVSSLVVLKARSHKSSRNRIPFEKL